MARSRNIKPGFFKNEYLGKLNPLVRLLFAGLWTLADREGRLEDRPLRIKAEILPYDNCDVDALLDELAGSEDRFITRYEVEELRYIQITNFTQHQNPHIKEQASIIPAPDKHRTSTMQTPDEHRSCPAESLLLNPESLLLNPESLLLNPESLSSESLSSEATAAEVVKYQKGGQNGQRITGQNQGSGEANEIFNFYIHAFDGFFPKGITLTQERKTKILARLKCGYSVDDLKLAITNIRQSAYHCGDNDNGKVYATIEFICRNNAKLEEWMNFQPKVRGQPGKIDKLQAMYDKYKNKEGPDENE